jgi:predicted homoserine dehydrogenase-like protein
VRDVPKDQVLTYADVQLPAGRFVDRLRAEQDAHFAAAVGSYPTPRPDAVAR